MTTTSTPVDAATARVLAAAAAARGLDQPAFLAVADDLALTTAVVAAPDGPLAGITVAVKDNIDVAGVPTTAACPTRDTPAAHDAVVVGRLRRAGAVPVGKTNMDQFATGLVGTRSPYGACHSVASQRHVSGGSSSGSAVAVAAGVVDVALGTDTAGSGRVPAAFNGIVGVKPTRGLISTRGVFPACPTLDCISIFSRTVQQATVVLGVAAGHDPGDRYSRRQSAVPPAGVAARMTVVGVPDGGLDLAATHREAWKRAVTAIGATVRLVPVDVSPMLAAARLLYEAPFVAERLAAFGDLLEPDGPHLDPVVRQVVLAGRAASASEVYEARRRLLDLARAAAAATAGVDAVLLPTTPDHPTLAEVAADPIGVNARLGTYTNMANLLDLCAVALPMAPRTDGLPFGVQLLAPAFADGPLLDLAARIAGEGREPAADLPGPGREFVAVCGAHLSGEPQNDVLVAAGGRLQRRALTARAYRMVEAPGPFPRPALVDAGPGGAALEVEVWDVPHALVDRLAAEVAAPLEIGTVQLADGCRVRGYVGGPGLARDLPDITASGGWRAHLRLSPG